MTHKNLRDRFVLVLAAASVMFVAGPASSAGQAPRFTSVFGDGMVLPHGEAVALRGTAEPGVALTLQVGEQRHQFRSNARGEWRQRIQPLRAGGPYTFTLRDANGAGATLANVLAGELWLCSGQSNMEFPVAMSSDHPADVLDGHPGIRLLSIAHQTALSARQEFSEAPVWQVADGKSIQRFPAICYFFARQRIADEQLPIGLINASWGGSAIEAWIGERQLARLPALRRQVELLRRYRTDPRDAELAFAGDWLQWWQAGSSMGRVWERGVLDDGGDWRPAMMEDWRSYADGRLASFTGNLWFSTHFELTEAQRRKGAVLVLGGIDEVDTTWINGRFVGNSFGYGTRREYSLEVGMLQPGINQVSMLVTSTYGAGGMTGPAADVGIRFEDGTFLPLARDWKYRIVPPETGYPPRAPWESVAGVSGMFNGMIAPLDPLRPTGVIWYQGESNAENPAGYDVLLTSLISGWRKGFARGELPFIVVQLPNYGTVATVPGRSGWAAVRQAQQQVALRDEHVGLAVTQDLGDDTDIHPRGKYAVAQRVVQVARALQGGGVQDGIVASLAAQDDTRLTLDFHPPLAPADAPQRLEHFILCTPGGAHCVPAPAIQQGSRIDIDRTVLPAATLVRYCWSDGGVCPLRSSGGLPLASFELPLRVGQR